MLVCWWAQLITASLELGRAEPRPLLAEYVYADDGLVTVGLQYRTNNRYLSLTKYDSLLKRQWQKTVLDRSLHPWEAIHLAIVQSTIYIFFNENDKNLWLVAYDLSGKPLFEPTKLLEGKSEILGEKPIFIQSRDRKQLAFLVNLSQGAQEEMFWYGLLDGQFPYKIGTWKLPYPDSRIEIYKADISTRGNLFLLVKRYLKRNPTSFDEYNFVFFKFMARDSLTLEVPIENPGYFLTDLNFLLDRDENVQLAGFYATRRVNEIGGLVFMRIEGASMYLSAPHQIPFPDELKRRYLTQTQIQKNRELRDIYLNKLILRSDGGLILSAERFYITTSGFRDIYGFWYTRQIYHYEDILVFSISPQGVLEWSQIVPKYQANESPDELSFVLMAAADALYFFYRTSTKGIGSNVYYSVITMDGQAQPPKPLISNFRSVDYFYRSKSRQVTNRLGIIAYLQARGNVFRLLKIAL
ncbi:MAG: hypothetical protein ACUVRD_08670 [Bacteroidia bacterium]